MDAGEQHRGAQPGIGDFVAVAVWHAFDQAVGSESSQVVGGLARGDRGGVQAAEFAGEPAQVAVGEPVELSAAGEQRRQEGVAAGLAELQPGDFAAGPGEDRVKDVVELLGSQERVVVESLDAEQASVGGEADLPQGGADSLDVSRCRSPRCR